jgi:phosphoglycerate dehydrogenase-like enzyme
VKIVTSNRPSGADTARGRRRVLLLASDSLFATLFTPAAIARLEASADWERHAACDETPELRERIARADVLMTTWHSPFLRTDMLEASAVALIVHCGGEIRARMEPAILDRVTVVHTPEPMAHPVAEMALAMTLALVRRLPDYDRAMRQRALPDNRVAAEGETLRGRRVGLVGLGRIGRAFARLVAPLEVDLVAYDPYCPADGARQAGARLLELDELLRSSSVVVLAAGLTRETRNLLDRRRLALLPDGACLINVARGGLVDLEALVEELQRGRLSAALDVTDPIEPLPPDHRLRHLPNVLLTPHVAAGGLEVRRAMGTAAIEAIERFLRGEAPKDVVTRALLARMT